MRTAAVVVAVLVACDLIAVGLLAVVVWSEGRRLRRSTTKAALFLAGIGLVGIALLYAVVWQFLSG